MSGEVRAAGRSRATGVSVRTTVILLGLVVVIGAGIAVWMVYGDSSKSVNSTSDLDRRTRQVAKAKPQVARSAVQQRKPAPSVQSQKPAPPVSVEDEMWLGTKVVRRTTVTNDTRVVETIYTVDGKCHKYFHNNAKPVLDNAADQILALATADAPGGVVPPLPVRGKSFERDFANALKREIVINEDDSEEVKSIKERVRRVRQEMLEAMVSGMSAEEVLSEHRKMQEHDAAMRMKAVKGLREYLAKGDAEGACEYCEKINVALESMGIMRIELPRSQEDVIAERRALNAERRATQQKQENAQ